MLPFLYYCLKVLICSGVLYGYYLLALRNRRFHQWNRWYLLGSVVLSFGLPVLQITLPDFLGQQPALVYGVSVLSTPNLRFTHSDTAFHFSLSFLLSMVYAAVAIFLLVRLLTQVQAIQRIKGTYPQEAIDDVHFYNTTEPGTPFSFFKNIFWNSSIPLHTKRGQQILRHEMAHVREQHSADTLFIQLLSALAFWNPFLYLIKKELSVVHEFIADQRASTGDDHLQYASLLLTKALGTHQLALGHSFFHSPLKRRIVMLTTLKNPRLSYARRIVALPLGLLLMAAFSFQCQRPAEDKQVLNKKSEPKISDLLPANARYYINGKVASKEEVEKLDPSAIANMNVLTGSKAIAQYGEQGKDGVVEISTRKPEQEEVTFTQSERPAQFPGGIDGWRRYLESNLQYPEAAQEKGIQGVVRVQLTVEPDGNLSEIKALNDPGAGLAEEAVRVISKGPKWVPARQKGETVRYRLVQNLTYQLQ